MRRKRALRLVNAGIVFCCLVLVLTGSWVGASLYQRSRYRDVDLSYAPQWDGERWVRNPDAFTCLDYTVEMLGWLHWWGIGAYQVVGVDRSGQPHSWVGVDVFGSIHHLEPQTLCFFDPVVEGYTGVTVNYASG